MSTARDKFKSKQNKVAVRGYKSLYLIVVEGETEQKYYQQSFFSAKNISVVNVKVGRHSNPKALIDTVDTEINKLRENKSIRSGDQAWIVLDRDSNEPESLEELIKWQEERPHDRFIGFSDPQFEYWLILHYELCSGIRTGTECLEKLKQHNPNYEKNTNFNFDREKISVAVVNGNRKFNQLPGDFNLKDYMINSKNSNISFTNLHILTGNLLKSAQI